MHLLGMSKYIGECHQRHIVVAKPRQVDVIGNQTVDGGAHVAARDSRHTRTLGHQLNQSCQRVCRRQRLDAILPAFSGNCDVGLFHDAAPNRCRRPLVGDPAFRVVLGIE